MVPSSIAAAMSLADWRRRRAARVAARSGDANICPYCRTLHPEVEEGGTKFAFGYPSVKFACCGKVAFLLKDPKTKKLMRYTRIGDGKTEWLPTEAYFAWVAEQAKPRGRREDTPHKELLAQEGPRSPRPKPQAAPAAPVAATAPPLAASAVAPAAPSAAKPSPAAASPATFIAVAKLQEIAKDKGTVVQLQGKRVALFRVGEAVHAIDDTCAHAGRSLGDSVFEEGIVTCNGHGWRYDVSTGKAEHDPERGVRSYAVKVEDGVVLVAV